MKVSQLWICYSNGKVAFDSSCGSSFLLNGHLWVIISEPFGSPGQVIIVYLTSKKQNSDLTVTLFPGDHKFIKHHTVISYADARIVSCEYINRRVQDKDIEPHDNFQSALIKSIQQGLINSPRTPRDIKKIFIDSSQTKNSD